MPKLLPYFYTNAAAGLFARDATNRKNAMRLFGLVILGMGLAASSFASTIGVCNKTSGDDNNQMSYQPFNSFRGQIAILGTGLAPSITLPSLPVGTTKLRIDFQNSVDYRFCLDAGNPNDCGTNPPTGTVSNTAWVFKQASVVVLNINPISGTTPVLPTTMYVSGSTAGTLGFSFCGMR